MNTAQTEPHSILPALKLGADGRRRVDYLAVIALAWPLFVQFAVTAAINLTDTWFIGRLGTDAVAGMNAVFFLSYTALLFFGGIGFGVQTIVAQAFGAGRLRDGAKATWAGLWLALACAPLLIGIGLSGEWFFSLFGLPEAVAVAAQDYWLPRLAGGFGVVANFVIAGFFNGIGRTRVTLYNALIAAGANVPLNYLFIVQLDMGMFGAGLASTLATFVGLGYFAWMFLSGDAKRRVASWSGWRCGRTMLGKALRLGVPLGFHSMLDVGAFAVFQLMIGKLGATQGAATQIGMMLTSFGFLPCAGLNFAAATMVGQSIGAGDKDWASTVGTATVKLALGYMAVIALVFAIGGEWLTSLFVAADDPLSGDVIALGGSILLVAAFYQLFDALNLSCLGCLRGAGDVMVPTLVLVLLAWGVFIPLSHTLIYETGQGWIATPGVGMGALGGWVAALVHITLLGSFLLWRWRSGRWRRIAL